MSTASPPVDDIDVVPRPGEPRRAGARARGLVAWARLDHGLVSRYGTLVGLAGLALVTVVLRTRALGDHFWVDEGLSVGIASHPFLDIPHLLARDGSPPLYYLALHVWMSVFGAGEATTHALSVLFAALTVPAAWWAGASLAGRRAAWFCAVLAAVDPFLTAYAQETRMYSLLVLLGVVTATALVRVLALRRRGSLPVFVLGMTAMLYTHNWALFFGLGAGVAALVCARGAEAPRAVLGDAALGFGAVAVLYAPWVPTLLFQAAHTGAPWSTRPVLWSLSQGMYGLLGGRGASVALLLVGGMGVAALVRTRRGRGRTIATALLAIIATTLVTAWVYSKLSPAWAERYLAVLLGPTLLVCGIGLARARTLGVAALVLTLGFWISDPRDVRVDHKSNVATVVSKVRTRLRPDTLVLSPQPEQVPVLDYYLHRLTRFATPLGPVSDPRMMDWRDALARIRRSGAAGVLASSLAGVAPGRDVALVLSTSSDRSSLWLRAVERRTRAWRRALRHDPRFVLVARVRAGADAATVPVVLELFRRRA